MDRTRGAFALTNGLQAIQYSIDFVTAILLLTGQITTSGIFVIPEGFFLSATGPVLGGASFEGQTEILSVGLRTINVLSAILLILNVLRVTGPYVTSGRVYLVFSGEIFGIKEIVGAVSMSDMNQDVALQIRKHVTTEMLSAKATT